MRLQYEGLHNLCFICGQYGHKEVGCPKSKQQQAPTARGGKSGATTNVNANEPTGRGKAAEPSSASGPWTVVQQTGWRSMKTQKGKTGNSSSEAIETLGEKSKLAAKPTVAPIKRDSGKRPTVSSQTGPRFTPLEVNVDHIVNLEDMDTGGDKDKTSGVFMRKDKEAVVKGEDVSTSSATKAQNVVRLNVSHEVLAKGLKPLGRPWKETIVEVVVGG